MHLAHLERQVLFSEPRRTTEVTGLARELFLGLRFVEKSVGAVSRLAEGRQLWLSGSFSDLLVHDLYVG